MADTAITEDVYIRPARLEDTECIADIAEAAWESLMEPYRDTMGPDLFQRRIGNWRVRKRRQVTGYLEQHPDWVIVAELDSQVVGFATYSLNKETQIGEIGNNAVLPEYQGHSIAGRMYEVILERFEEAGMVWACVGTWLDEGHARARRAYEKAGFEQVIRHVEYFKKL